MGVARRKRSAQPPRSRGPWWSARMRRTIRGLSRRSAWAGDLGCASEQLSRFLPNARLILDPRRRFPCRVVTDFQDAPAQVVGVGRSWAGAVADAWVWWTTDRVADKYRMRRRPVMETEVDAAFLADSDSQGRALYAQTRWFVLLPGRWEFWVPRILGDGITMGWGNKVDSVITDPPYEDEAHTLQRSEEH